jgi:hypothetical protein
MKLNRKKLNIILPQIKAHLNVAIMMDNPEYPGLIDFLFQPKSKDLKFGYLNKLTCGAGCGDGLFTDAVVETLGKPLVVDTARFRGALKGGGFEPELRDGTVNGINIQADPDNSKAVEKIIKASWKDIRDFDFSGGVKFVMSRIDYELTANTMIQFVSHDVTRIFMCGYDVDCSKGEDFINFAATDGRRLAVCKFPFKHLKMGDDEGKGGDFIFDPLHLFIPESGYSRIQWQVTEYAALIRIQTEDYSIDCWAKPLEWQFPNYARVIPDRGRNKEWIILNARSARNAFNSIKGLINNGGYSAIKNQVFLDAEDPKRVKLAVPGASIDIDGEASRPMRLRVSWDCMNSTFFDTPSTKFLLQSVDKAILAEETKAVRGTTMKVTKVIMPMTREDNADEWGIAGLSKMQTEAVDFQKDVEEFGEAEDNADASSIGYGDFSEDDE